MVGETAYLSPTHITSVAKTSFFETISKIVDYVQGQGVDLV